MKLLLKKVRPLFFIVVQLISLSLKIYTYYYVER